MSVDLLSFFRLIVSSLTLQSLPFSISLLFFRFFPCFFGLIFLSKDFGGSAKRETLAFLVGFPCFFFFLKKSKGWRVRVSVVCWLLSFSGLLSANLFRSAHIGAPHFGVGRRAFVPICSDFPVSFRFVPICAPCFREYPGLFRFVPICSDFFRFASEQIRETLRSLHCDSNRTIGVHSCNIRSIWKWNGLRELTAFAERDLAHLRSALDGPKRFP